MLRGRLKNKGCIAKDKVILEPSRYNNFGLKTLPSRVYIEPWHVVLKRSLQKHNKN